MKVIDLLIKISNGEEVPNKIKYRDEIWVYDNRNQDYLKQYKDDSDMFGYFFCNLRTLDFINDEVEIIEEKKIEKKIEKIIISMDDNSLPYVTNNKYQKLSYSEVDLLFASKINELIDVINEMRDNEC
jgi:hypothetical protein